MGPRARSVAVVAVVLALAACGATPVTPGGVGTSAAGDSPATAPARARGVDAADGPTSIPFEATSSSAFEARAKQAVDRMRSSGAAAAYATSLVLLSSRVVETGYPTDDLKTAFSSYAFRAGPTLTGAARAGVVTTVDGVRHPVELMSARDTLAGVVRLGIGCAGTSGGACPVITRATLGTLTLSTSRGRALVPVWQFWADGLSTPYQVVAATEASLPDLPMKPLFDAYPADVLSAGYARRDGDRAVVAGIMHGTCDTDLVSYVLETPDLVVVGGDTAGFTGACNAAGVVTPSRIPLAAPLATRPIVDVGLGQVLGEHFA